METEPKVMNVRKEDSAILLEFPEIKSYGSDSALSGDFFISEEDKLLENKLYFDHSSEETSVKRKPQLPNQDAYAEFHPEGLALDAFRQHQGFRLAPEDIGALILLDFGKFVEQNSEKCAPIFNGKFGEKKTLTAWLNNGESLASRDVLLCAMRDWEEQIKTETNSGIRDVLHPNFSSKNKVTDLVYSGLLMGAAKEYFTYSFMTLCGIPKIRVEGTKEDWKQIKAMISGLGSLDELQEISPFYQWANSSILDKILKLYDGEEDIHFWSSIAKHKAGSGYNSVAGWLPSLSLYAGKGEVLPLDLRWQENKANAYYPRSKRVTTSVVDITLVSNNAAGRGNIDPTLSANIGFTSVAKKDGFLKPVLGIDAYVQGAPKDKIAKV